MRLTEQDAKALLSKPGIRVSANSVSDVSDLTGMTAKFVPAQVVLPEKTVKASQGKCGGRQPNKTESEYRRLLELEFPGCEIVYEGLTFLMINGHRYTPDWIVKTSGGWMLCVEVKARGKNGFRLPSYQRAKLAYDQARIEWDHFRWRFAEKHSGTWNISGFPLTVEHSGKTVMGVRIY